MSKETDSIITQYKKAYQALVSDFETQKALLLKEFNMKIERFSEANAKYKKGDFVRSVIGIIRIEKISYDSISNQIFYSGLPYWYNKDKEIVRTKYKNFKDMSENYITHFCRLDNENDKIKLIKVN